MMDIRKWRLRQVNIIIIILFFLSLDSNGQSFLINGTIKGKDTGYVILQYRDENNQRRNDITTLKKGKFHFRGTVARADFATINTDTSYIYFDKQFSTTFFIEPGSMNISFHDGEADKAVITGSRAQAEYATLKKSQSIERRELKRLSASSNSIKELLKNGLIDSKTAEEENKKINEEIQPIFVSLMNSELSYIKKNLNSHVSLILLYSLVGRISNDSIDILYSALSNKVKNSSLHYRFVEYTIRYRKAVTEEYPYDRLKINEKAPPFTIYNNTTGDSMTVGNFEGKSVILEFWGLYCFPCLKFNPLLEEIRKQYGKNKLEIISININGDKELPELITYINKNKLTDWIHVIPNTEAKLTHKVIYKGDFRNYYGLGVPRTILIDISGRVIYKNYGYSSEELEVLKSLIDETVNEKIK